MEYHVARFGKKDDDQQAFKAPRKLGKPESENPKWLLPTAITLLVLGPAWIIVYYISKAQYPLPVGNWNLAVGFVFMAAAMALLTRWK